MPEATAENSLCAFADAESYFATRLHSEAWLEANQQERHVALIQATRLLNARVVWRDANGDPLALPAGALATSVLRDARIQWACCELALDLIQNDPLARDSMEGLSEIELGELRLRKDTRSKSVIPGYILAMLNGLADMAVSGCSIPVKRT